jgi:short subunit dehydrogenase-like uncharacterized protein
MSTDVDRGIRPYDLVLIGATGFTGRLTAEYLAEHAGAETRWALAGRDQAKLEAVRSKLAAGRPAIADLPLLIVDVGDPAAVSALANSAKVVLTTVGPYIELGEPLVAACAAAGTDYVDITGEPEFVDLMWLRYHRQAQASGARLVHSCGFDSIPYDLGALWTVKQLDPGLPIAMSGFGRIGGGPSAGSYHTGLQILGRVRRARVVARQREEQEAGAASGFSRARVVAGRPHRSKLAGGWVLPAPTIDPQHVVRSARVLDEYGPDFSYSHHLVTGSLAKTAGIAGSLGTLGALSQLRPTRTLLRRLRKSGGGPSAEQRSRASFTVVIVAEVGGSRLVTEISGGDPAGDETAKMLAESALCLAFDELPPTGGQVTSAVAMGEPLIERLAAAGVRFRVVSQSP